MNTQLAQRSPAQTRRGTIVDGATESTAIDKRGLPIAGLRFSLSDAAFLTFLVSDAAAGTFDTVKNSDAASARLPTSTTFAAGRHALKADDLAFLAPYNFVKIVTSVAQSTGTAGATFDMDLMA